MSPEILLVDDDQSYRKILQLRLRSFMGDFSLIETATLKETRELLDQRSHIPPDLVILDQHLPDGQGLELLTEGWFEDLAVIMISSDPSPEMAGASVQAGAQYFLQKIQIREPLFPPLIKGILERNQLKRELNATKLRTFRSDTVRKLVSTLRHEINNPLGAVLGAAYLLRHNAGATEDQLEAAKLIESSGQRIKHVLNELCSAVELAEAQKAKQDLFQIPGDPPWEPKQNKTKDPNDQ